MVYTKENQQLFIPSCQQAFSHKEKITTFTIKIKHEMKKNKHYFHSARKAITLIVKVANAGGALMILVVLTVSLLLSALVKFVTSI
jgi:hypothetical protein